MNAQFLANPPNAHKYPDSKKRKNFDREFGGLKCVIESAAGTLRRGKDKDGKDWCTLMEHDYGFIRRTKGEDGEGIDCYLGPDQHAQHAYVIYQKDPDTGEYDEQKVMLGFPSCAAAVKAYEAHYDRPGYLGTVEPRSMEDIREAVLSGKKNPFAWNKKPKRIAQLAESEFAAAPKRAKTKPGTNSGSFAPSGKSSSQKSGVTGSAEKPSIQSFKYNGKKVKALVLGVFKHPETENELMAAVNLNYWDKKTKQSFVDALKKILKSRSIKDRYALGKAAMGENWNKAYRLYKTDEIKSGKAESSFAASKPKRGKTKPGTNSGSFAPSKGIHGSQAKKYKDITDDLLSRLGKKFPKARLSKIVFSDKKIPGHGTAYGIYDYDKRTIYLNMPRLSVKIKETLKRVKGKKVWEADAYKWVTLEQKLGPAAVKKLVRAVLLHELGHAATPREVVASWVRGPAKAEQAADKAAKKMDSRYRPLWINKNDFAAAPEHSFDAEFERKHPRDEGGQFKKGSGSSRVNKWEEREDRLKELQKKVKKLKDSDLTKPEKAWQLYESVRAVGMRGNIPPEYLPDAPERASAAHGNIKLHVFSPYSPSKHNRWFMEGILSGEIPLSPIMENITIPASKEEAMKHDIWCAYVNASPSGSQQTMYLKINNHTKEKNDAVTWGSTIPKLQENYKKVKSFLESAAKKGDTAAACARIGLATGLRGDAKEGGWVPGKKYKNGKTTPGYHSYGLSSLKGKHLKESTVSIGGKSYPAIEVRFKGKKGTENIRTIVASPELDIEASINDASFQSAKAKVMKAKGASVNFTPAERKAVDRAEKIMNLVTKKGLVNDSFSQKWLSDRMKKAKPDEDVFKNTGYMDYLRKTVEAGKKAGIEGLGTHDWRRSAGAHRAALWSEIASVAFEWPIDEKSFEREWVKEMGEAVGGFLNNDPSAALGSYTKPTTLDFLKKKAGVKWNGLKKPTAAEQRKKSGEFIPPLMRLKTRKWKSE